MARARFLYGFKGFPAIKMEHLTILTGKGSRSLLTDFMALHNLFGYAHSQTMGGAYGDLASTENPEVNRQITGYLSGLDVKDALRLRKRANPSPSIGPKFSYSTVIASRTGLTPIGFEATGNILNGGQRFDLATATLSFHGYEVEMNFDVNREEVDIVFRPYSEQFLREVAAKSCCLDEEALAIALSFLKDFTDPITITMPFSKGESIDAILEIEGWVENITRNMKEAVTLLCESEGIEAKKWQSVWGIDKPTAEWIKKYNDCFLDKVRFIWHEKVEDFPCDDTFKEELRPKLDVVKEKELVDETKAHYADGYYVLPSLSLCDFVFREYIFYDYIPFPTDLQEVKQSSNPCLLYIPNWGRKYDDGSDIGDPNLIIPWLKEFGVGVDYAVRSYRHEIYSLVIKDSNGKWQDILDMDKEQATLIEFIVRMAMLNIPSEGYKFRDEEEECIVLIDSIDTYIPKRLHAKMTDFLYHIYKKTGAWFIITTESEDFIKRAQEIAIERRTGPVETCCYPKDDFFHYDGGPVELTRHPVRICRLEEDGCAKDVTYGG